MYAFTCATCGTQFPPAATPPALCPICADERQYIGPAGQRWLSPAELRDGYRNQVRAVEPGLHAIASTPTLAIGQSAHLIQTPAGNLLWDCISLLDEATEAAVRSLGGITAISISHPHFYSSMGSWARAFGAPIYLHAANRPWVVDDTAPLRFWEDDRCEVLPTLTAVCCGGHFPGSSVLHWPAGAAGRGALFTGDTMMVASDRRYVSFMYSYPNLIPLDAASVRAIVAAVEPFAFDRIYGAWPDKVVDDDAHAAVQRSATRYIAHLEGRL